MTNCNHQFYKDRNPENCLNCGKTESELMAEHIEYVRQQARQEAIDEVLACKPEEKKPPKELEPFIELDEEITNAYLMAGRYVGTRDALKEWEHKIEALKPKE